MKSNFGHHWHYKNLTVILLGVGLAILLTRLNIISPLLSGLHNFGYLGAFIAGILLVPTLTVCTGAVILIDLCQTLNPYLVCLIAVIGSVIADLTIFRFIKDDLIDEIEDVYRDIDKKHHLKHIFHSRYFHWALPVVGALIISSPLPDELGVSLLGISRMKNSRFILLTFVLHLIGMFPIVALTTIT